MQITVNVQLDQNESFGLAPAEAAARVLVALDGDPDKDYATCYVHSSAVPGVAGKSPEPTPPDEADVGGTLPALEAEAETGTKPKRTRAKK